MAFTQSITHGPYVTGDRKEVYGKCDFTGVTTGNINTGLKMCESLVLTHVGTAVEAAAAVVNETLPVDGSAVTVVGTSGDSCLWVAKGY